MAQSPLLESQCHQDNPQDPKKVSNPPRSRPGHQNLQSNLSHKSESLK